MKAIKFRVGAHTDGECFSDSEGADYLRGAISIARRKKAALIVTAADDPQKIATFDPTTNELVCANTPVGRVNQDGKDRFQIADTIIGYFNL